VRRTSIAALIVGTTAVLGLVAGCSGSTTGSGSPTTSDSSAPSSSANSDKAPKVQHPLDPSAMIKSPCSALTPSDLSALGLPGAQTTNDSGGSGAACAFSVGEKNVAMSWPSTVTHGLSSFYAIRSEQAYFIPTTVSGYPAVEGDSDDTRSTGSCVVNVGVNEQKYFFASADGWGNGKQACSMAKKTAAAIIKNLQAAQGGG
jgi:hypothetical protein